MTLKLKGLNLLIGQGLIEGVVTYEQLILIVFITLQLNTEFQKKVFP